MKQFLKLHWVDLLIVAVAIQINVMQFNTWVAGFWAALGALRLIDLIASIAMYRKFGRYI
jgi:hypothetical protein